MIESSIGPADSRRIRIFYIPDLEDHARWVESLGLIVPPYGAVFTNDETTGRICAGRGSEVVTVPFTRRDELSGTEIRAKIARGGDWRRLVPAGTAGILDDIGAEGRLRGAL
ncbi:nicotinamide mononucleotide adenylyltransferase [Cenarchaeum symbiosum A]|uniref:Nicotinamide mononucleotide adenylyltransferase n=1 Tax=Cenarchaeum symbiosum (strain A) TaxID=414004 RepID=A0RXV5_CENSY|nr:nicotinamide mononucleotide adenylyltransferase [Cenarchaeum symbiosum A]